MMILSFGIDIYNEVIEGFMERQQSSISPLSSTLTLFLESFENINTEGQKYHVPYIKIYEILNTHR